MSWHPSAFQKPLSLLHWPWRTSRARLFNWRVSLFLLLAAILVLTPMFMSVVLSLGSSTGSGTDLALHSHSNPLILHVDPTSLRPKVTSRVILSLLPVLLYLFGLSYIPLPSALSSSDLITSALSRLIVLGTIILGLLSGFGAISNAWAFFPLFSRTRYLWHIQTYYCAITDHNILRSDPTEQDIHSAESALTRIRNDLQDRRAEVQSRSESEVGSFYSVDILYHTETNVYAASSKGKLVFPCGTQFPWRWAYVFFVFLVDRNDLTMGAAIDLQELQGLEALEFQMSRNLEVLKQHRESAKFSDTLKGKIFNYGGRIFAIYCVIRVLSVSTFIDL